MYGQYGYATPSYMGNTYQNPYQRQNVPQQMQFQNQPQVQQPMQMPQQMQPQIPIAPQVLQIQEFRHGTEDEIRPIIIYPNCVAYYIDYSKGRMYAKRADGAGMSSLEYYELTPINADGSPIKLQEEKPQIDMGEYIKKSDLAQFNFITMEQLNDILSKLKTPQQVPQNLQMGVKPNGTGANTKPTQM